MKKSFKILLATDYSEAVKNAERYAVQFAHKTSSSITFLHVYEFPLSATPSQVSKYMEVKDQYEKSELDKLKKHRDEILKALNIHAGELKTECVVEDGSAGRMISKLAHECEMDFIIVGTHGVTGFRKVFYGTHAWEVMKKSSVPVLAIPQDALFREIKHIVFATEYRAGELPVINYLTEIAKLFHANVTVLHVTRYVLSKQFEADFYGRFKKEVNEKIHYDKLDVKLVVNESISEGLNKFCSRHNIDWLVMSPEKPYLMEKLFFPDSSITRKMSFQTRIPLLSVPDYYNPEYAAFWKLFQIDEKYINEEL